MKFTLIATIVVLALAQGSFAQDATDMARLTQYFEDMKTKISTDMTEFLRTQDLANQAQTYVEPFVAQVQEQVRNAASGIETQLGPMTTNIQAQMKPLFDNFQRQVEALMQEITTKTKAISN